MNLYSWNVNGVRAAVRKGFLDWLYAEQPDVIGLQETKAWPEQLTADILEPKGYRTYWATAEKKGYSGVALITKKEPLKVQIGLGIPEYDREGRTIVADYGDFVLITAYFPNGGRDHSRIPYKMAYKAAFLAYCEQLRREGRKVFFCGDVNTSHHPIDLARPKQNVKKTGFMPEERVWLDQIVEMGYIDTYRHFYPDQEGAYSWWTQIGTARERNVGWRLDYFFASPEAKSMLIDAAIHPEVMGSDHCPVSLKIGV
ncbi:MAG: exodeoxyribonuclease III [Ardenticatenaceae bacterium]|nr:exodeoxyribonuclease III [Ardenticatenaceae bacterium]